MKQIISNEILNFPFIKNENKEIVISEKIDISKAKELKLFINFVE